MTKENALLEQELAALGGTEVGSACEGGFIVNVDADLWMSLIVLILAAIG